MRNTGEGVEFERIRRITGYLGTLNRFNDAKRAEESDRVMHGIGGVHDDSTAGTDGTEPILRYREIM